MDATTVDREEIIAKRRLKKQEARRLKRVKREENEKKREKRESAG